MNKISQAQAGYRTFIDELAADQQQSALVTRVRTNAADTPGDEAFNALLGSLGAQQREWLAEVLFQAQRSATHDVLATLSWWMDCQGLSWSLNGEPMPVDESGMGLHGDFEGRCEGWRWPDPA